MIIFNTIRKISCQWLLEILFLRFYFVLTHSSWSYLLIVDKWKHPSILGSKLRMLPRMLGSILNLLCTHKGLFLYCANYFLLIHKTPCLLGCLPFSNFRLHTWPFRTYPTVDFNKLFYLSDRCLLFLEPCYYLHLYGHLFGPHIERQLHLNLNGNSQLTLSHMYMNQCCNNTATDETLNSPATLEPLQLGHCFRGHISHTVLSLLMEIFLNTSDTWYFNSIHYFILFFTEAINRFWDKPIKCPPL